MTLLYLALGMAAVLLAAYPITALALRYANELEPTQPLEAPPGTAPEPPVAKRPYPSEPERTHLLTVDGVELYKCGKKYIDARLDGDKWYRAKRNEAPDLSVLWHEFPQGSEGPFAERERCAKAYRVMRARADQVQRRKEWQS